jgi:heme/copper-type cytochrome/quinol oxidase subunit 2
MAQERASRRSRRQAARREIARRRVTAGAFLAGAVIILSLAAFLFIRPFQALRPSQASRERRIAVTMAGFDPQILRVPAGTPIAVRLVNPDSPYHSDGGGWHQFRIERLGVDVRVPPRSERRLELPPLPPGVYAFYCDICCGGKDNPAMRGTVQVTG